MRRREFLSSGAAFALLGTVGPPPSNVQMLRVLLGRGDAQPIDARSFSFQGRRYRGSFARVPQTGEIVSVVPLESYLYSVVPGEMPPSWPFAALSAQAIVARTYVLQRSNPLRAYDLVPSEIDQVYAGVAAEHPQTTAAVDATAGTVLRFGGGFAQIAFSSCCGGHTEASSQAWATTPIPYLNGVVCTYCAPSPWYRWSERIGFDRLQTAMPDELRGIERVTAVTPDPPDSSGRSLFWTIEGPGARVRVRSATIRRALGYRALPSLLVRRFTADSASIAIDGGGLGHGVGLCQWGARGMAATTGATSAEITSVYFPGTTSGVD